MRPTEKELVGVWQRINHHSHRINNPEALCFSRQAVLRAWRVQAMGRGTPRPCGGTAAALPPGFRVCISPPTAAPPEPGSASARAWHRAGPRRTALFFSWEELWSCCSLPQGSGLSAPADGLCQSLSSASLQRHRGQRLCLQGSHHRTGVPDTLPPAETQTLG